MSRETRTGPEALRQLMFSVAYRMTGSVSDSEDIVQDAAIRIQRAEARGVEIESPRAYASAVTTRVAIDHLRSARATRETYVGPWLPEPLLVDDEPGPAEHAELSDSLSHAFLVVLETLSPVERAVFLLREVFGFSYGEIGRTVERTEDNVRQIAVRARRHVDERRHRFDADRETHDELLRRFLAAAQSGETDELRSMLAEDVVLYSDGGGKAIAARKPIYGADRVARFIAGVARKTPASVGFDRREVPVNGELGRMMIAPDGSIHDVLTVDVADGRIQTVRIVRNPDKLKHLTVPDSGTGAPPEGGPS